MNQLYLCSLPMATMGHGLAAQVILFEICFSPLHLYNMEAVSMSLKFPLVDENRGVD